MSAIGEPVDMLLTCPSCGERHLDEGRWATKFHHTHACQHCGMCWRPAVVATRGVRFLPGFKSTLDDSGSDAGLSEVPCYAMTWASGYLRRNPSVDFLIESQERVDAFQTASFIIRLDEIRRKAKGGDR